MITTRIPPSPTGELHIGTARTALFNYLYAKQKGGRFILRLEDTDQERSKKQFEKDILLGLEWLGIKHDNQEVVRQSQQKEKYLKIAKELLSAGLAYEEEGRSGAQKAIILKNPHKDITFTDIIRGEVIFEAGEQKDIVLIKSDGLPSYNFSVVIDDNEAGVTHVIRGEDHIPNTPKQIAIQEALKIKRPRYAHLPLILGSDRSKLSKRHGATSVNEYRQEGYLSEAVVNFMVLLGWNPGDEREIFSTDELVKEFSLERVHKGGAIFNKDKMNWICQQYIQKMTTNDLKKRVLEWVGEFRPKLDQKLISDEFIRLVRPRISKLADIEEDLVWFKEPKYEDNLLIWKKSDKETTRENLISVLGVVEAQDEKSFTTSSLESVLMPLADKRGRGEVLWPLRVALSGKDKSPGPFELLALLGKKEGTSRIEKAIDKLISL